MKAIALWASQVARIAVVLVLVGAGPESARGEPSDRNLILGGLALIPPTYGVGVVVHEGSHALAAKLVGAEVTTFRPWPGRDPVSGAFQFGLTRVSGLRGTGDRLLFFFAPKVADAALLGGYLAWFESSHYPAGSVAQLFATVMATGLWIDFAKDTLAFSRHNDLVKAGRLLGLDSEWQRLPLRLAFAAASAGLGLIVWRGHERLFASNDPTSSETPRLVPLANLRF